MENLKIAKGSTLVLCMLIGSLVCSADKLSPGQKAPPHATNSGGSSLKAPFAGNRAADVGSRSDVGRSGGSRPPATPPQAPKEDGVTREETEDLKEIDGQLVRVVKGNFGYDSPEGLPVAVKYEADENGNRASFTIGNPAGGGGAGRGTGTGGRGGGTGGKGTGTGGKGGGTGGKGTGAGGKGGGTGGGSGSGGGKPNSDKTYLPPS
uniref:Cuticular protein 16 n=1 Tax=Microplitis mediator TaxID=375433 RepID=A0A650DLH2_9HYME|nr:cuticular protein 16 [Microplitis mediator]